MGTPDEIGWGMSVATVNHYLLGVLIGRGLRCEWADERCNAAARTARRARAWLEGFGRRE